MTTAPLMLGVSGLRGIVGESLTPDVVARYAAALATWLYRQPRRRSKRPSIVLGMDGRRGGDIVLNIAANALRAAGCDVVSVGIAMTPTIGFMVDHGSADAGMIVTASHNPQEWNGLKFVVAGGGEGRGVRSGGARLTRASAPPADVAGDIIDIYRSGDFAWRGPEDLGVDIEEPDRFSPALHEAAVLGILRESGDLRRIRRRKYAVMLDTVGGAGGLWVPRFLEALGCEVHELYPLRKYPGIFPHTPEPTRENLTQLCRATKRKKADIGFAVDPDGDRLAIVDDRGQYIGEEYTLALAAESLLSALGDAGVGGVGRRGRGRGGDGAPVFVANLSTSRMLDDIAAKYGANVLRTPVGEANVVEAMKRESAAGRLVLLGGEGNGGIIWPRVTYIRDSLSAVALVLQLMARTGRTISELVAEVPAYAIEKRKVDLARRDDAQAAIEKLASRGADILPARGTASTSDTPPTIDTQDGVRIDFPAHRAWLHVRPSNTEPIMRLIAEAPSQAEASKILDDAAAIAKSA